MITASVQLVDQQGRATPIFLRLLDRLEKLPEARFSGSKIYDPASIAAGATEATTVPVAGAALGMKAEASFSLDQEGVVLGAYVSSSDVVSVVFHNTTAGAVDLGSGTLRAYVWSPA